MLRQNTFLLLLLLTANSENNSIWMSSNRSDWVSNVSDEDIRCEAICNGKALEQLEYDDNLPATNNCGVPGKRRNCSSQQFQQCLQGIEAAKIHLQKHSNKDRQLKSCPLLCQSHSSPCLVGCSCAQNLVLDNKVRRLNHHWYPTDLRLQCQDIKIWQSQVTAYVSWKLQLAAEDKNGNPRSLDSLDEEFEGSSRVMNTTDSFLNEKNDDISKQNVASSPLPYFIVEIRGINSSVWQLINKTSKMFMAIEGLRPDTIFQVRVRGFDSKGMKMNGSIVSPWIRTLSALVKPKPVKEIWLRRTMLANSKSKKRSFVVPKLNAEICWEPSEDMLCHYDVVWLYENGYHKKEVRQPETPFSAVIKHLDYSKNYNVTVAAVILGKYSHDGDVEIESQKKWMSFVTPTCEDTWNFSYAHCSPPTPENISYAVIQKINKDGDLVYDLEITWSLPSYATHANGLKSISVRMEPVTQLTLPRSPSNHMTQGTEEHLQGNITEKLYSTAEKNITPDKNSVVFHSIAIDSDLIVTIKSESDIGSSQEGYVYIPNDDLQGKFMSSKSHLEIDDGVLFTIVMFATLLIISSFLAMWINRKQQSNAKGIKCQKVTDYGKVKVTKDEWYDIGHGNQICSQKLEINDSEGIMADDEFEVTLDRLVIREMLGEGEFGVVHKGYLSNQKYDRHKMPHKMNPTNTDSLLWKIVAVKMLRKGASPEEEKQLIHEMETLKSLGHNTHPNVVSLIGCHTKKIKTMHYGFDSFWTSSKSIAEFPSSKPLLLLLVEHCALGDLKSFLQKVWKEGRATRKEKDMIFEDEITNSKEDVPKYTKKISPRNLNQRNLKYADLDHSSPQKGNEFEKILIMANHTYGFLPPESKDYAHGVELDAINPSYLLSYARQIVLGMEYLSGHRVVHRDLAARNILLCADGRTVKISDFGMSRDIYLQNVYHKASTQGKLPIKWMALEALLHGIYTTQSDVWSFGILLWEIVTLGGTPYPGISVSEIFKLLQSGYRMERPHNCSPELYQLMCWCWEEGPSERPSFSQLRHHLDNLLQQNSAASYLALPQNISPRNNDN